MEVVQDMVITKFETWWVERGHSLFDEKRQGGAKMGWDVLVVKLTTDTGIEGVATCMAARSGALSEAYLQESIGPVVLGRDPHDREAIRADMTGLGKIGYVANSPYTVVGESWSAGRLYEEILALSRKYDNQLIQLTDNIHLIEAEAFMGCKKLYEIVLPPLLRAVSSGTFASCSNLTKLTLNDQLKMIGDGAFYQCRQLRDVYMPDSVTTIGEDAFMECSHLQRVRFSPNIERIGANAFRDCSSLPQPLLPNETLVGKNAFKGCKRQ